MLSNFEVTTLLLRPEVIPILAHTQQVLNLLASSQTNTKGKKPNGRTQNLATITYEVSDTDLPFIDQYKLFKIRPTNICPRLRVRYRYSYRYSVCSLCSVECVVCAVWSVCSVQCVECVVWSVCVW